MLHVEERAQLQEMLALLGAVGVRRESLGPGTLFNLETVFVTAGGQVAGLAGEEPTGSFQRVCVEQGVKVADVGTGIDIEDGRADNALHR